MAQVKYREIVFIIGYILWVIANAFVVTVTILASFSTMLKLLALSFWGVAISLQKWKKEDFVRLLGFLILCVIIFVNTREEALVFLGVALFASYQVDIYRIAKVDLYLRFSCIILTILFYFFELSPGNDTLGSWGIFSMRYSLGYYHPNNLFAQIFALCVALLVVYREKLKFYHYFCLIMCIIVFGIMTQSRTGILVLSLAVFMVILRKTKIFKCRMTRMFIKYSYLICFAFSLVGTILYSAGNTLVVWIDMLLTGRFKFAARALQNQGITIFGQKISYLSTYDAKKSNGVAVVVDNFYIYILITFGVVFTIVILYLLTKQQGIFLRNNEIVLAIILFCYAFYSITEKPFSNINNHFILLSISTAIVHPSRKIRMRKKYLNKRKKNDYYKTKFFL